MSHRYPQEMYLSYARSIHLEVERRVRGKEQMTPSEFGNICRWETDRAMKRMIAVTGTVKRAAVSEEDADLCSNNH